MITKQQGKLVSKGCKLVCSCDHPYEGAVGWSSQNFIKHFTGISDDNSFLPKKMPNDLGWWLCKTCKGVHYGLLHHARFWAKKKTKLGWMVPAHTLKYHDSWEGYEEIFNAE